MLLFAEMQISIRATRLRAATVAVFDAHGHTLPSKLDTFPYSWVSRFKILAKEIDLVYRDLEAATEAARLFIDPVLANVALGTWDPERWEWKM